jgi:hypothetical protein
MSVISTMSKVWTACAEAGPLASFPPEKLQTTAQNFHAFYSTFRCFQRILRHQNTTLELYHEFQQTWDECIDFFHHNPTWLHEGTIPQPTLLHQNACYVYTSADLDVLERRVNLQLHIMNAKIDDIIL